MADIGGALLAASIRAVPLVMLAALVGALVGRWSSRAAHAAWVATAISMLLIPLGLLSPLRPVVRVAVPAAAVATALDRAGTSGAIGSGWIRPAAPWEHVQYRPRRSAAATILVTVWLAGMVLIALRLLAAAAFARRIVIDSRHPEASLHAKVSDLLGDCRLAVSPRVALPIATGVFRPAVVLPPSSGQWSAATLRAVVAHEIAHVQRRDSLWVVATWLNCALFWFHPLAWIVARRVRLYAELASDECAVGVVGRGYARALVDVAGQWAGSADRRISILASGMIGASSLRHRIDRVLAMAEKPADRSLSLLFVPVLIVASATALATRVRDVSSLRANPTSRALLGQVHARDPQARADALFKLARWQGREEQVIPVLVAQIGDDSTIRTMPRWAYRTEGWAPALESWRGPSPGEVAALGLASFGALATRPLEALLDHPDPVARRNAAWAIGEMRHPRDLPDHVIARLVTHLADSDPGVRAAAAWALGDIGAARAILPLRRMLAVERDSRAAMLARQSLHAISAGGDLETFRRLRD